MLIDTIAQDQTSALKNHAEETLATLRLLLSEVVLDALHDVRDFVERMLREHGQGHYLPGRRLRLRQRTLRIPQALARLLKMEAGVAESRTPTATRPQRSR